MGDSNKSSAIFQPEWMRHDGGSWLAFLRVAAIVFTFSFRGSLSIQLTPQYPRDKRIYYIAIIFDIVEKNNSRKTSFFHTRFPITVIYIYFWGCYGISLSPSWATHCTEPIRVCVHKPLTSSLTSSSNDWGWRDGAPGVGNIGIKTLLKVVSFFRIKVLPNKLGLEHIFLCVSNLGIGFCWLHFLYDSTRPKHIIYTYMRMRRHFSNITFRFNITFSVCVFEQQRKLRGYLWDPCMAYHPVLVVKVEPEQRHVISWAIHLYANFSKINYMLPTPGSFENSTCLEIGNPFEKCMQEVHTFQPHGVKYFYFIFSYSYFSIWILMTWS